MRTFFGFSFEMSNPYPNQPVAILTVGVTADAMGPTKGAVRWRKLAASDFSLADPRANQVLQKLRGELAVTTAFRYLGRPVLINFPDWRTRRRSAARLAEIPDAYLVSTPTPR
jgi:hypothetical protein